MKKGLLIYSPNPFGKFNIGDYIQSIAARQFMGEIDEFIDRERLNEKRSDDVALIANGWYMHHPENWPPSDKIHPLFVALHINKLAEAKLLSPISIDYFKSQEPIGCRDYYTVQNLKKNGVNAYFSGCLTLTLGKSYRHQESSEGKIYFTDVNSFVPPTKSFYIKCAKNLLMKFGLIRNIQKRYKKFGITPSIKWVTAFYTTYSQVISDDLFLKADYIRQEIRDTFSSESEKFAYANMLLQQYAAARFVITSRIHCALPCLAMGTPVLYVDNHNLGEVHNCRLDGLRQLFHTIDICGSNVKCDLISKKNKISTNFIFRNKNEHREIVKNISKRCEDFVNSFKIRL